MGQMQVRSLNFLFSPPTISTRARRFANASFPTRSILNSRRSLIYIHWVAGLRRWIGWPVPRGRQSTVSRINYCKGASQNRFDHPVHAYVAASIYSHLWIYKRTTPTKMYHLFHPRGKYLEWIITAVLFAFLPRDISRNPSPFRFSKVQP